LLIGGNVTDRTDVPRRPQGHEARTVLVVEDDRAVRKAVRFILEKSGYRVLEAGSGEEALGLLDRPVGPVDLLLTDVVLPDLSGPQVAEKLRGTQPGLKVLYVSGHSHRAVVDGELDRLGAGFLRKPFSMDELTIKVREMVEEGRD